jgi:hypothetical protein
MTDAKAGLAANEATLVKETIEGKDYWMAKDLPDISKDPGSFLLPGFDEYMLGYQDRTAALHIDHTDKIVPGGNGMFLPTIVIGGQVVGTWKRTIKKDQVLIELSPFRKLSKADLVSLERPAELYCTFLGLPRVIFANK